MDIVVVSVERIADVSAVGSGRKEKTTRSHVS